MSHKIDWTTLDTGWVNCTYASGWRQPSNTWTAPISVRRVGKHVTIRGEFQPITTTTINTSVTIGTVPENFRPSYTVQVMGVGQYSSWFRIEIRPDGSIVIWFRHLDNSSNVSALTQNTPNNYWHSLNGVWLVD